MIAPPEQDERDERDEPVAVPPPPSRRGPLARAVAAGRRIPHPPWRSRRGLLLLVLLLGGFGAVATLGGMAAVGYSESTGFCESCHVMAPQAKGLQASAHRNVSCAECHVEPGVLGFAKAKLNGTKELAEVLTGSYPKPIPAPDHAELPPVSQTCLKCHTMDQISTQESQTRIVLRPSYLSDEANTRQLVAVVIRPSGIGGTGTDTGSGSGAATGSGTAASVGVHWHVQQKVTYTTPQPQGAQKIDLVEVQRPDGSVQQYVSADPVSGSTDVGADVAQLKATETARTMDCLDCHNRAGHQVPSVSSVVDKALASGAISPQIPYVKREATALLSRSYDSEAAADAAMAELRTTVRQRYPLVAARQGAQLDSAVTALRTLYPQVATPEMKVQAGTYPDNLGHQNSPGCFRCHDGTHYQVVNGKITDKAIPSACTTCHTFPQVGSSVASIPLSGQPVDHQDKLYVFDHKKAAPAVNPVGTSCGACHQQSYCVNCHSSGAVTVQHDQMLYNHAASIQKSGGPACAYCHQTAYCAGCHGSKPVLDTAKSPG
jgi:nitrate/TMAO reductase-like tetraheme cytochrome c subunit